MSAIRLARGFTGRTDDRQVRRLLPRPRRRAARRGRLRRRHARPARPAPASPARRPPTRSCCPTTTSTPSRAAFAEHGADIACVITEAAAGNMGAIAPVDGLQRRAARDLPRARRAADHRRGDDRVPGVAARAGTASTASTADLFTFGKVMARRAARGGVRRARRASWRTWRPPGPVYQAGTLSGNPLAVRRRAGHAAGAPTPPSTPRSTRTPRRLGDMIGEALRGRGRAAPGAVRGQPVLGLLHRRRRCTTTRARRPPTRGGSRRSSTRCSTRGVYLPPSAFEAWFVSAALDDDCFGVARVGAPVRGARPQRR